MRGRGKSPGRLVMPGLEPGSWRKQESLREEGPVGKGAGLGRWVRSKQSQSWPSVRQGQGHREECPAEERQKVLGECVCVSAF